LKRAALDPEASRTRFPFCVGYTTRFREVFLKNGKPFVANNNEEVNLVVYDARFAAQRGKSFQEDLKYTKKLITKLGVRAPSLKKILETNLWSPTVRSDLVMGTF
jgi:hypothetical protein